MRRAALTVSAIFSDHPGKVVRYCAESLRRTLRREILSSFLYAVLQHVYHGLHYTDIHLVALVRAYGRLGLFCAESLAQHFARVQTLWYSAFCRLEVLESLDLA